MNPWDAPSLVLGAEEAKTIEQVVRFAIGQVQAAKEAKECLPNINVSWGSDYQGCTKEIHIEHGNTNGIQVSFVLKHLNNWVRHLEVKNITKVEYTSYNGKLTLYSDDWQSEHILTVEKEPKN